MQDAFFFFFEGEVHCNALLRLGALGKFISHPFPVLTLLLSLNELWGFHA